MVAHYKTALNTRGSTEGDNFNNFRKLGGQYSPTNLSHYWRLTGMIYLVWRPWLFILHKIESLSMQVTSIETYIITMYYGQMVLRIYSSSSSIVYFSYLIVLWRFKILKNLLRILILQGWTLTLIYYGLTEYHIKPNENWFHLHLVLLLLTV